MHELLLLSLGSAGLVVSLYFTAVAYRWLPPDPEWIPRVCRLDEATCASVVFAPQARVFGVPNSLLGMAWYVALIVGVGTGVVWTGGWRQMYLAASWGTVVLALYLSYALIWVLRVPCRLCFASHIINLAVLWLLLQG